MIKDIIVSLYGKNTYYAVVFIFDLYPIWLPLLLGILFWEIWVRYIRSLYFLKTPTTLLEIKIPREVLKSPLAMEIVLTSLHQTGGETTVFDRFWEGKTRAWFSLEIVSIEGKISFFIWTRTNMKNIIESHLYSQYPSIEVTEVEDYAKPVVYNPEINNLWSTQYKLNLPDPFPIKTYVDYGLDRDPKEEFKNDPLVSVLEVLGAMKAGENAWFQIIMRAHKKEKHMGFFSKKNDWSEEAEKERQKILASVKEQQRLATGGEGDLIGSLERSVKKFPFDCGIRSVYIARKDVYNQTSINSLRGLLRPFSQLTTMNSFAPSDYNTTFTDYPWEDILGTRVERRKRKLLDAYKRRMYFFSPHKFKSFVLNTEEIATLFHFPGQTATTPGLPRIQSKKSQAPDNLPI